MQNGTVAVSALKAKTSSGLEPSFDVDVDVKDAGRRETLMWCINPRLAEQKVNCFYGKASAASKRQVY